MAVLRREELAYRRIDDGGVVLSLSGREVHYLNETATVAFDALLAGTDPVRSLVDTFDVPLDEARADVDEFIARLRELGLIVEGGRDE